MYQSLTRAFAPGRWFPIIYFGLFGAWSCYLWLTNPAFSTFGKAVCVLELLLLVLNLFVFLARRVVRVSR